MRPVFGSALLLTLCWALSEDRRRIAWRVVIGGIALQWGLALLMRHAAPARGAVFFLDRAMVVLQRATDAGTGFLFGYLGGGPLPYVETHPGASFVLAFRILPLVLVISALSTLLLYLGILQRLTALFAWLLRRTLGLGGALALGAAVHVFLGMVEGPLLIRPYLRLLSRGEIFALMSCGLAGIAGTVMVLYATILGPVMPDALGAILTASVVSTPAALAVAALLVPFGAGASGVVIVPGERAAGVFDALVRGTADGVGPLVGIATLLVVAIALVTLGNAALASLPHPGGEAITLQGLLALPFRPVLWLIGIPWRESLAASRLMGTKTVLNELVAYLDLAALPAGTLSDRSRLVVTFCLCGFANFGSLGILVGGMGAMVPERRAEISRLGLRAILAGTLATCLSGATVAVIG